MASLTDIRTFPFPTLADPEIEDVITAVQILRGESDRQGRQVNPFREADREAFQRDALTGGNRLERVLATLDAIIQENPAAALGAALPGPVGGIASLAGLVEGRRGDRQVGDTLRTLARVATEPSDAGQRIRNLVGRNEDIFRGPIRRGTEQERRLNAAIDRIIESDRESFGRSRERTLQRERATGRAVGPV